MTQEKLVKVAFYCGIRKVGFIVTPTQHAVNMFNKVIKQYICKMCVSICNEKLMHFEGAYECNIQRFQLILDYYSISPILYFVR